MRIAAALTCALLFCFCTGKMLGAMQQSGYRVGVFFKWLKRKENMLFNRLCTLSLCLALASAVFALCFCMISVKFALCISALPFFALLLLYLYADGKYALKIPVKKTGRVCRLFAVYFFFTASFSYLFLGILSFLAKWNGSVFYGVIAYVPFCVMPIFLPYIFALSTVIEGIFENIHNKKFIKRAGQVLDETEIIRVAVVGSYGKTSVKNILKSVLSQKYEVIETPSSFNTPIGIAKTVTSADFKNKQVFIAEMGARKQGDILELCNMVKPDFAIFTGVCAQHIQTFGNEENVLKEKSEILKSGAITVCGASLKDKVKALGLDNENICFADESAVKDKWCYATETEFTLSLEDKNIRVKTKMLGDIAVENMLLVATLALKMGLTPEEIGVGLSSAQPTCHRLQLVCSNGLYILDDGYNCNEKSAKEALAALNRFKGKRCVVTPGIVECGVMEQEINERLGQELAKATPDSVILVGDTLVGAVKSGYLQAGGDMGKLVIVPTLEKAKPLLSQTLGTGDCVLFLNDLPDVY